MRKIRTIEMKRLTVEEYQQSEKMPLVVVLDDVRSMYNIGSVFRTCDAFRVEAVFLCGICQTPPSTEIHKTALGAEESVSWTYFADTKEAVRQLHAEGYTVLAIEQAHNSVSLDDLHVDGDKRYAIVLGHEVFGVAQDVIDLCDGCIEIPQYGTKHSLNVSVTAGIVMYDIANRLRGTHSPTE